MKFYRLDKFLFLFGGLIFLLLTLITFVKFHIQIIDARAYCVKFLKKEPSVRNLNEHSIENNIVLSNTQTTKQQIDVMFWRPKFIAVAKSLRKAQLHARGIKTSKALKDAVSNLNEVLKATGLSYTTASSRDVFKSTYICPEEVVDLAMDLPRYENGIKTTKCPYSTPIHKIVSVIIINKNHVSNHLKTLVEIFQKHYPFINILIGTYNELGNVYLNNSRQKVHVREFSKNWSMGKVLNDLIKEIKTEFILFANDLISVSNDTDIRRLVRELQRLNVKAIGGASLNSEQLWSMNCYQTSYRNFSQFYYEGYDESMHDCVFCDFIDGPFLIRKKDVQEIKFDDRLSTAGLFEDIFLRLKSEYAVCPDVMFHTATTIRPREVSEWLQFGLKHKLHRMKFASQVDVTFDCKENNYACNPKYYLINSPCCVQELRLLINHISDIFEKKNILYELDMDHLLNAVKFKEVQLWDEGRWGYMKIFYHNHSAVKDSKAAIESFGYSLTENYNSNMECGTNNNNENYNGESASEDLASFIVKSKHWVLKLKSSCFIHAYESKSSGISITRVNHHGANIPAPRNPGLYLRHVFAFEPYRHGEKFFRLGPIGDAVETNDFLACKDNNNKICLDQYNSDGNMQFFIEPLP